MYDVKRDGQPTEDLVNKLKSGDIIFFSNTTAEFNKKSNRFYSIAHIGIVAERTDKYFDVSGVEINDYDEDEENICSIEFVFHPIVNISLQTTEGVMEISEFHIAVNRDKQTASLLMKICNSDKYSYAELEDLLDINELFTKLNNLKTEYL